MLAACGQVSGFCSFLQHTAPAHDLADPCKPHNAVNLGHEVRISGKLKGFQPVRFQSESSPYTAGGHGADTGIFGHQCC
jgi:hypothetical protein